MTTSEILDRILDRIREEAERRLKPGLKVRVHPRTFWAIAHYTNARVHRVDGLETITLRTAAGPVPVTPDPDAPEGHPFFDREPTP